MYELHAEGGTSSHSKHWFLKDRPALDGSERVCSQDEDDQQFLMDQLGNIELSQSRVSAENGGETDRSASHPKAEIMHECWDDDASCLEALDEVERTMEGKEEIPDELMIQALAECDIHTEYQGERMEQMANIINK